MNKFKEWLEKAAQDKIDNYEDAWDVVGILNKFNELTKDTNYIEVPKEVKLSSIMEMIKRIPREFNKTLLVGINGLELIIDDKNGDFEIVIKNDKIKSIFDNLGTRNKLKQLYQYWIAETKIINDLEEEDE